MQLFESVSKKAILTESTDWKALKDGLSSCKNSYDVEELMLSTMDSEDYSIYCDYHYEIDDNDKSSLSWAKKSLRALAMDKLNEQKDKEKASSKSKKFDSKLEKVINESDTYVINKTPYGFTEVYYKGYSISNSNAQGGCNVNIDGDECYFNSFEEAKAEIDKLDADPDYHVDYPTDVCFNQLKDDYTRNDLDFEGKLFTTSSDEEVKKALNESDESNSVYRDGVNITEDVIDLLDKSFVQLCIKQKHSVDEFKDFWNGQKQSIDEFVQSSYGEDE